MGTYPLIGVAGVIGAGKDVIANHLIDRWGFQRLGFSFALKQEVGQRLRRTLLAYWRLTESDIPPAPEAEQGIIDLLLQTKPPVVRELLQEYGTEVRRADDADYWVHKWCSLAAKDWTRRLVVPDVRFDNEAKIIQRWGVLVKVVRPTTASPAQTTHASETGVALWPDSAFDAVFMNEKSIADLEARVDDFIRLRIATWPATATP